MINRHRALLLKRIVNTLGFPVDFARAIMFESQTFLVRFFLRFSPLQLYRLYKLNLRNNLCINFGCWTYTFKGWINVDGVINPHADLLLDIRRSLPFKTESARFIFAEHVIEHFRYDEAVRFLKECYRILMIGGAIRIITPDLKKFAQAYLENDRAFFQLASPTMPDPVGALNLMFRQGGDHNYIFDFEELKKLFLEAGFKKIFQSSFLNSAWSELNLDRGEELRKAESLYIEAVK